MAIQGWYYLHENGDLIFKPGSDSIVDIRDSDFALCSWPIDPKNRKGAWELLVEALALGAEKPRVYRLADKWRCNDDDAEMFASVIGVEIEQDGSQWCAHRQDFVNLEESPAGFGEDKLSAMAELAKALGLHGGHMWRLTFCELVKQE